MLMEPTINKMLTLKLIHGAHRIELKGESIRKLKAKGVSPD